MIVPFIASSFPAKNSSAAPFSSVTCVSPFSGFRCSSARHHETCIMFPVGLLLLVAAAAVLGRNSGKKCYQITVTPSLAIIILLCIKAFFWHIGMFWSSARGYFLVLSVPWHAGSPPEHDGSSVDLADVRSTCSGDSQLHVPTGRHSEHVRPSRPLQTHI